MSDAMAAAQCIDDLKEAGLNYDKARILVEFIVRSQEHLATKADIKALEVKLNALEASFIRQLYLFGFGIIGTMIAMLGLFLAFLPQLLISAG